ncbi:protein PFC0760c-like isoform X2 [Saccostrea cucullata]|uniref:protein PFC0760c-like isoform X2 n=1 Tax=Saccostrea cuccullata TaxID=36930 RepID=UPI002ED15B8D
MMFAFVVLVTALTVVNADPGHIGETPLTKVLSSNNSTATEHAETSQLYDGHEHKKSDLSTLKAKGEVKIPLDQKLRLKIAIINKLTERLPMEKKKNFTKSFMNLLLKQKDTNQTLLAAKSADLKNIVESKTGEAEKGNNGTTAVYTGVTLNTDTAENSTQSQKSTSSDIKTNETPVHQLDNVMNKDIKGKHRRTNSRETSPSHALLFEIDEDVQRKRINSDENDDDVEDDEDQDDIFNQILFSDESLFGIQPVQQSESIQQREPIQQSRVGQQRRPIQQNQTPNTWQQRPQIFPNNVVANSLEGTPNINTIRHLSDINDPEQEIKRLERFLNFAEGFAQTGNDRLPSIQSENDLFEAFNDESSFLNSLQGNFQIIDEHDQDSTENNAVQFGGRGRDFSQTNIPRDGRRPAIARINGISQLQEEDSGEETNNEIVKSLKNDVHRFLSGTFQSKENKDLEENSHSNNNLEPESKEEDESLPGVRNVFRISERDRIAPNLIAAVLHDNRNPDVNVPRFNNERQMQEEDSNEDRESKITGNEIHIYQNRDSQSYEYDNFDKKSEGSYESSRKSKSGSSEKRSSDEKSGESKSGSSYSDSRSREQDFSGENYDSADKSHSKSNSRSKERDSSKDSSESGSSGSNSKSSEQESTSKSSSESGSSGSNSKSSEQESRSKSSSESGSSGSNSKNSESSENSKQRSKSSEESSKDSKSSESSENGSKSSEESSVDSKSSENSDEDSKSSEESSESNEELPQQINPQRYPPKKNNDLPLNNPKPENIYTPTLHNPKPENLYTPTKPKDRKIFGREPEPDPPKETQVNWDYLDDNNFGNLNLYQPINDDQDLLDAILEIEKKNYGIEDMKSDSSEYSKERNYYKPKRYKGYTQYSDDRKTYKKSQYIDNRKIYGNRRKYSGYSFYRPKYVYGQSKYAGDKLKLTDKELYELNQVYRASKGHRPARVVRTWNTHHYPALVERNRQVRAYLLGEIGNDSLSTYGRRGRQGRRGYGNRRGIHSTRQSYGRFGRRRGLMRNKHPVIEYRVYHWRNNHPLFENRDYYYPNIQRRR